MKENEETTRPRMSNIAWNVAIIAILAATAIGGNYALIGLPQIELSSVMIFLSGFIFGIPIGALVGLITTTIYYMWNPWGPFIPPIHIAAIGATVFIGIVGGIVGRNVQITRITERKWFLGAAVFGVFLTLMFDLVTNYGFSLFFNIPYIITIISGFWFSLLHILSNGLLFGLLTPPVVQAIQHLQLGKRMKLNNRHHKLSVNE